MSDDSEMLGFDRRHCPVCGKITRIIGETTNDSLVASCMDTFTKALWDDCITDAKPATEEKPIGWGWLTT